MIEKMELSEMTPIEDDAKMKLEGYAIVFDVSAQINGYEEKITSGALESCDLSDVALFVNHDSASIPLARTPNTLTLEVDEKGLKFTAELPETESAREVYESVKRGDLRGCSFAFDVDSEEWEGNTRIINSISKVYEISIVFQPAYEDTEVETRSKKMGKNAKIYFDRVDASAEMPETNADILSTAEYRSAFYKTLQGKQLSAREETAMKKGRAEIRANEFSTSTNSAAILPATTLDEIVTKARKQGGIMEYCRAFSVPSKIAVPVSTPADKAAWHVEGAAVESEKVTPTTVIFDGNEIIKVFSISTKVQAMSINAFESYLTDELESCVMETLSDALINGTGSGQGTGLMTAFDSDNTVTAANTNIAYSDVIKTVSKLKRGYAGGAKWAMNNHTLWNVFYGMVDGNQRPIFIADAQNESVGKILGYDIIVDDNLADNVVIFGNFSYMGYNLPSGIVIETSRESSFKSALIDYRALAIADCKPILPDAFVKLVGA